MSCLDSCTRFPRGTWGMCICCFMCSRMKAHSTLDRCSRSLGSSSARFWSENHWGYWRWRGWYRIWTVQLTTRRKRWISWWIQTKLEVSRMASSDWFCCTVLSRSVFDAASCLCQWFSRVCSFFLLCKPGCLLLEWSILTFYSMIMRQQIPYARVLATVPREMRDRLPPELTGILEVNVSVVWLRNILSVGLG